jgi:hypothetical protein
VERNMKNAITTPRDFFDQIVVPDCEEFLSHPEDIRAGFHACISLNSLTDWVHKADPSKPRDWASTLRAKVNCLERIRLIANNAKHFPSWTGEWEIGTSVTDTTLGSRMAILGFMRLSESGREAVFAKAADGSDEAWLFKLVAEALEYWKKENF